MAFQRYYDNRRDHYKKKGKKNSDRNNKMPHMIK